MKVKGFNEIPKQVSKNKPKREPGRKQRQCRGRKIVPFLFSEQDEKKKWGEERRKRNLNQKTPGNNIFNRMDIRENRDLPEKNNKEI